MEELLKHQKRTYEEVFLKEAYYDTPRFHYDWWLFPIKKGEHIVSQSSMGKKFSIDEHQTKLLVFNTEFMERYIHCIQLYLNAQICRGWNGYTIRFEKVLWSLVHFIESTKLYNKLDFYYLIWKCALVAFFFIKKENLKREITRSNSFVMFNIYFEKKKEEATKILINMGVTDKIAQDVNSYVNGSIDGLQLCYELNISSCILLILQLKTSLTTQVDFSLLSPSVQILRSKFPENKFLHYCFDELG